LYNILTKKGGYMRDKSPLKELYHTEWRDEEKYSDMALKRKEKLSLFNRLISEGCSKETALEAIGTSKATYHRWNKAYQKYGLNGLETLSRRPRKLRSRQWTQQDLQLVIQIRKTYPLWGKYKIAIIMEREYGRKLSASSVGRILSYLMRHNFIKKVGFYYGKIREKRKRKFDGHAKRWEHWMKAKKPGELIQVDHACVEFVSSKEIKHFQAVCPVTKWSVEMAYGVATSAVAAHFLDHMQKSFPFSILSIQVDGGSEFMSSFEDECGKRNIALFVLPPKSPKYNGNVERANSTAKYEFYYLYDGPTSLGVINLQLQKFVEHYNTFRPHQALQYLTPKKYLEMVAI
jgi:putative transposase